MAHIIQIGCRIFMALKLSGRSGCRAEKQVQRLDTATFFAGKEIGGEADRNRSSDKTVQEHSLSKNCIKQ